MRYLVFMCVLALAACGAAEGESLAQDLPDRDKEEARTALLKALDKKDKAVLTRAEVVKAWRSVSDKEWEAWDTNDDDALDRGEIGEMTKKKGR